MELSKTFQFSKGYVVKDDFIDLDIPIENQLDKLYEDMFQFRSVGGELAFDIGWYDFENTGCFKIYIIKNQDWDNPIYRKDIYDFSLLKEEINAAIGYFNDWNR